MEDLFSLARFFQVLSSVQRLCMLRWMSEVGRAVTLEELAHHTGTSVQNCGRHMKKLQGADLVTPTKRHGKFIGFVLAPACIPYIEIRAASFTKELLSGPGKIHI